MKLKDIYPSDFWNKFNILSNEEIDKILQIDIEDEKFKINIDLICNILNIQIYKNQYLSKQGKLDGKIMTINSSESSQQQRFTKAYLLSKYLIGHEFNNKVSKELIDVNTFILNANVRQLAMEILLPDKLIKLFMNEYLAKNNLDISKVFVPNFINEMSYNFGLSEKIISFYLEKENYILDRK